MESAESEGADIALAFPDDVVHRRLIAKISKGLRVLKVRVYFVAADRTVTTFDGESADGDLTNR